MSAGLNKAGVAGDGATVAVIIPTFNHVRYLAEAIRSVRAQSRPVDEIVVVDDGSTDDPATVVGQFQNVRFVRQENQGPSAARNAGLRNCSANFVAFLDADDRLLPTALEAGFACMEAHPGCAFVYGGYRHVSESGEPIGPDYFDPIDGNAHLALLRGNRVVMHATVLYRREHLLAVQGFNEAWRQAEDYDVYLRLAQTYPIASHPEIVAEYRRHGQNVSSAHFRMLKAVLGVLDQHEARIVVDAPTRAALREGRVSRRNHYVTQAINSALVQWRERHEIGPLVKVLVQALRWEPLLAVRWLLGSIGRRASKVLPRGIVRWMEWLRGRPYSNSA